jgi:hypothetical protein
MKKEKPYGTYIVLHIFGLTIACGFLFAFIAIALISTTEDPPKNTLQELQDDWDCCTPDHEKHEMIKTKKNTIKEYYKRN